MEEEESGSRFCKLGTLKTSPKKIFDFTPCNTKAVRYIGDMKYRIQRMEAGRWFSLALRDVTIRSDSEAQAYLAWCQATDIETEFRAQVKTALGWITLQVAA